ncbi:hypothetical protein C1701_02760 [Actinoalloteichus sp. AHMU CJ021]|uniref:hypothetical protein n=1 Tax=Actinoalloteichus sp. AHMU CJ021 TaxID=2072503 RepID=UPI000CA04A41|nr:hypothetical protein C1701_02760 [Actinoalloteichus sp. AHMU CJ021]
MDGASTVITPTSRTTPHPWSATVPAIDPTGTLTTLTLVLAPDQSTVVLLANGTHTPLAPPAARHLAAALRTQRRLLLTLHSGPACRTLSVAPTATRPTPTSGARLTLRSASQIAAHWPLILGPGPARSLTRLLDEAAHHCRRAPSAHRP